MINDILDLARIESGREELVLETIAVEDLCQRCLMLVTEQAQRQGLDLELEIEPGVTACWADRRRLIQILVNLLSNAVKFTERGSVTLRVGQTEQAIEFAVIDTGIGISEDNQAELFQPFQQVGDESSRRSEGTGLGLALSQQLAQLHGGRIVVQSRVGQGSRFTLLLPSQGGEGREEGRE